MKARAAGASPRLPGRENFRVFLLAGQSNMAGRGELEYAEPDTHPRVLMLGRDGDWQYAVDPVHYDRQSAGAGLARYFAMELATRDREVTIGLVPGACGSSPISSWEPGAYFAHTDSHPYDDALARTRRAMQDGVLAGILWHQGESDTTPELCGLYKDRLVALIERFRKDLQAPGLPFIIGQLGQFESNQGIPGVAVVDAALKAVGREVPVTGFVPSDGLTSTDDNIHFNTRSLREFGRRYAHCYRHVAGQAREE